MKEIITGPDPIHMILSAWGVTLAFWLFLFLFLLKKTLRKGKVVNNEASDNFEPDWSIPIIDAQAYNDSAFHRWDTRYKIFSILVFCFCVAFLNALLWAALAHLIAWLAVFFSGVDKRKVFFRISAMSGFLGMFLVVMPFTAPVKSGDLFYTFDAFSFLTFNARGFYLAVVIILKATAIALMMEPLLATAPFPVTVNALSEIGVPGKLCQMILLTHRYIFVFLHEARRMTTGMRVRGFRKKTDTETLKTLGNFLGMLFVRSYERTQRVYEAMLSRGYTGSFPVYTRFCASPKDRGFAFLWILLGVALILGDRISTVI